MRYLPILMLVLASCSVNITTQFAEVSSVTVPLVKDRYVYENDTLALIYSFWNDHGTVQFEVINKLNVPLYVDWKKSSLVIKGNKLDYWVDQSTVNATTYYGGYLYQETGYNNVNNRVQTGQVNAGASVSESVAVREERVTFIPPNTGVGNRRVFQLIPGHLIMDKADKLPDGTYEKSISYAESKFKFRNFITYSTKENMENERYIDNEFYISKIGQSSVKIKRGYYDRSVPIAYYEKVKEYSKPTAFFIRTGTFP